MRPAIQDSHGGRSQTTRNYENQKTRRIYAYENRTESCDHGSFGDNHVHSQSQRQPV